MTITHAYAHTYNPFSLTTVVVCYKIGVNTESANAKPLFPQGNTELGSCKFLITFPLTLLLFKDTVYFINIEPTASSTVTDA